MNKPFEIFENRGIFANAMLDKYFSLAPTDVVSDIGAGFGFMKTKIEDLKGFWQPFDYVRKIEESTIWDLNYPVPSEAKKAGVVVFLEVLEHLANPLLGIQNIANHMEKGGYLILSIPNPQSSKNRINLLLKGSLYAFQKKHLIEHHVFTPWEHIVVFFLENSGFEILEYAAVDTGMQKDKPKSIKGRIKKAIEGFIEKRDPKAIGASYGLVARKL